MCVVLCCYFVIIVFDLLVKFFDVIVDLVVCVIYWGEEEVYFILIEFCLLVVLFNNVGKVFI